MDMDSRQHHRCLPGYSSCEHRPNSRNSSFGHLPSRTGNASIIIPAARSTLCHFLVPSTSREGAWEEPEWYLTASEFAIKNPQL
jgi:hypothetical protein